MTPEELNFIESRVEAVLLMGGANPKLGEIKETIMGILKSSLEINDNEHRAIQEVLRIKLAACGVAALCNTETSMKANRIGRDNPYWSASYEDVISAVSREIEFREAVMTLKNIVSQLKTESERREQQGIVSQLRPGTGASDGPRPTKANWKYVSGILYKALVETGIKWPNVEEALSLYRQQDHRE